MPPIISIFFALIFFNIFRVQATNSNRTECTYHTESEGTWGDSCSKKSMACFRDANFAACLPRGLNVGCSSPGFSLSFTSSLAVENYLPQLGNPAPLSKSYVNASARPISTESGNFGAQVTALALSVAFDRCYSNFSSCSNPLETLYACDNRTWSQVLAASSPWNCLPFFGKTVSELFLRANTLLGGCASPPPLKLNQSIVEMNLCLSLINSAFVGGKTLRAARYFSETPCFASSTGVPTTARPTTAQATTARPTTQARTTSCPTTTTAQATTAARTTALPTTAVATTAVPTTAVQTTAVLTTAQATTAIPTTAVPTTAVLTTAEPTTAQPTTAIPTTAVPTTAVLTTAVLTTAQPTTAEPTTAVPTTAVLTTAVATTAVPTTAQPTTAQPTTAVPTTAVASTAVLTTAQPTTAQPTTAEPTTAQPTTAEPTTAQPTTAQPTTAEPTTAQPTTAQPTTAVPTTAVASTAVLTTAQPTTAQPTTAIPTTAVLTTAVPTTAVPTTAVFTTAVLTTAQATTAQATTAQATTAVPTTAVPTTAVVTTAAPIVEDWCTWTYSEWSTLCGPASRGIPSLTCLLNPGCYLQQYFGACFNNIVSVGCIDGQGFDVTFTNIDVLQNYLFLTFPEPTIHLQNFYTNPLTVVDGGSLVPQLLAATLTVGFDNCFGNFSSHTALQNLYICNSFTATQSPLMNCVDYLGFTVNDVIVTANSHLGGCPAGNGLRELSHCLAMINSAFSPSFSTAQLRSFFSTTPC